MISLRRFLWLPLLPFCCCKRSLRPSKRSARGAFGNTDGDEVGGGIVEVPKPRATARCGAMRRISRGSLTPISSCNRILVASSYALVF